MCRCVYGGCAYEEFFDNHSEYYIEDQDTDDEYCIFHAPKSLKEKFSYDQNMLFKETVESYLLYCKTEKKPVDFSNVVFHLPIVIEEINLDNLSIDFKNAVFYEYVDIRNIKCNKLTFKDTKFHKGGALKNRKGTNRLFIKELHFRPVVLESDFVIDIGMYADEDGIKVDIYGTIKNIEFENHKEGKGIVYFVGLNSSTEKADFRNRILDNVSFQNCDLSECYFLNAKVDKTEFRNCIFPQGFVYSSYDILRGKSSEKLPLLFFPIVLFISIIAMTLDHFNICSLKEMQRFYVNFGDIQILFLFLFPLLVLYLFYIFASIWIKIEAKIASLNFENSKHSVHTLNPSKFIGRHFSIADEVSLYKTIRENNLDVNEEKKRILDTFTALAATYIQLKNNFSKYDYQMAGSFFYAQRYFEALSSRNKDQMIERLALIIHHFINGFGERFMKPVMWFLLTGILFAAPAYYIGIGYHSIVKQEGVFATEATPKFLLDSNASRLVEYKIQYLKKEEVNKTKWALSKTFLKDGNSSKDDNVTKQTYFAPMLKEDFNTALVYSFSRFVSPLTSQTKAWFKTEGKDFMFLSFLETALLYLFFGAFLLALKNRIKR